MKKPYPHTVLSDKVCNESGCRQRLKMNLVLRKPSAKKCYAHFILRKRQRQNSNRGITDL